MKNPITNNVFDSRDLLEYKEYLEQELLDSYNDYMESNWDNEDEEYEPIESVDDITDENFMDENNTEFEHYKNVSNFVEELEGYGDFKYGKAIIHEDYFVEYCEELVKDICYLPKNLPIYIICNIDWEGVADDLKYDYTSATFEGETYYMRA